MDQIVKKEPSTDTHINGSNNNTSSIPLIPSLPQNPFGPSASSSSSTSNSYKAIPPPFSNNPIATPFAPSFGHSYPAHSAYADMSHSNRTPFNHPLSNAMNSMFYATPFLGQQPHSAWNQNVEYNEQTSSDTPPTHYYDATATHNLKDTKAMTTNGNGSHNANNNNKQYSFTPGMQPGAYYLIPLNTQNPNQSHGHSHNHHHQNGISHSNSHNHTAAYMPLINANNKNEENEKNSTNSSPSSSASGSSSNSNQSQSQFLGMHNQNMPFPHLPFPHIPLTPTAAPLPLSASSYHDFTLAPIPNSQISANNNKDKKTCVIMENNDKNDSKSQLFNHNNNLTPSQTLSFPPLPTNDTMSTNSNINHLKSPFAEKNDLNKVVTDDIDSSSDQDMDIALGTTMPIICAHNDEIIQNGHLQKNKIQKNSPKQMVKKIRKHSHKKKVKNTNSLQKIPALNKIDKKISLSPTNNNNNHQMNKIHKIVQKTMNNSTKINKIHCHRTPKRRPKSTKTKKINSTKTAKPKTPKPKNTNNGNKKSGKMEVAYSQQYPQVGFPFIYNADAEHGKKFICKFMDSSLSPNGDVPAFCDRLFGQKCHWMRHCLEKHVPAEMGQRYQCRYCNMKYAQNSSLKEHVAICHSNKPPSFKCPYCAGQITFTRWTSVLRHCRNQHPNKEEPKKEMREKLKVNGIVKNGGHRKRGAKRGRNVKKKKTEIQQTKTQQIQMHQQQQQQREERIRRQRQQHELMPPMNIMPSVNMNISMNQMLSNIRNVAMMPK